MFFLTWNLGGHPTAKAELLKFLSARAELGYVVATEWSSPKTPLAERQIIDSEIRDQTNSKYILAAKATGKGRTILIGPKPAMKWDYQRMEDSRIISASFPLKDGARSFRLVGIHGLDRKNYPQGTHRNFKVQKQVNRLFQHHLSSPHFATAVVMGDFNATPYELEMHHDDLFSAKREAPPFQKGKAGLHVLYNPTWNLLPDNRSPVNGTYRGMHDGSGPWWILDQILLGPKIAKRWRNEWNPDYCTALCQLPGPNSRRKEAAAYGSDHFPIWCTFDPEEMFQ